MGGSNRFTVSDRRPHLVIATAAALALQLAFPAPVHAVPVYAFSRNEITNFGFADSGVLTYFSRHFARFGQFGTDTHPRGAENEASDLPQSKVGPGGFPGENTFGPHGTTGAGYARADTRPLASGGSNVAEVYRTTPGVLPRPSTRLRALDYNWGAAASPAAGRSPSGSPPIRSCACKPPMQAISPAPGSMFS
jgi:hypothetical protein